MPNPMIRIHNIETDEIMDREMTNEEFEQYKKENEELKARYELETNKIAIRQSALLKLAELGLTKEEIAAL